MNPFHRTYGTDLLKKPVPIVTLFSMTFLSAHLIATKGLIAGIGLIAFPLEDPPEVVRLRKAAAAGNVTATVALGLALAKLGCTYQSAFLLRPNRAAWKGTEAEPQARAALAAQAWWTKHGLDVARLKSAGLVIGLVANFLGALVRGIRFVGPEPAGRHVDRRQRQLQTRRGRITEFGGS